MTKKRKLFDEMMEGVEAMRKQREGKITLRTHAIEDLPTLDKQFTLLGHHFRPLTASSA